MLAVTFGSILTYLPKVSASAITMTMPDIDWIISETATVLNLTNSQDYLSEFGSDRVFLALALQGAPTGARLSIPLAAGQSIPSDTTVTRVINISNTESVTAGFGYCNNSSRTGCNDANSLNSFTAFSVRGSQANLNILLSQLRYTRANVNDRGTPSVVIAATVDVPGVSYMFDGLNDHYYRIGHYTQNNSGSIPAETSDDIGYYCASDDAAGNTQTLNPQTSYQATLQNEGLIVRAKFKRADGANSEGNCSWNEADRLARASTFKSQRGYLANVTSAEENALLRNNLAGALNVWIGGSDGACDGSHTNVVLNDFVRNTDTSTASACANASNRSNGGTEGVFHFYDGPESHTVFWRYTNVAGSVTQGGTYEKNSYPGHGSGGGQESGQYSNFKSDALNSGEPNNSSSSFTASTSPSNTFRAGDPNTNQSASTQGEDNIVFNWVTADGLWNDLHQREPSVWFYGFIIEYGGVGFDAFDGILRENKPILFQVPVRRIPEIIPVDPQSSDVYLPNTLLVIGIPNVRVCFNQWTSAATSGTAVTTPKIAFDVATQGTANNSTSSSPRISGDRTTELAVWLDSQTAFNTINSSLGVRAYFTDSTNFNQSYFVRVRVVPIANNNPVAACKGASVGGSRTIELKPFEKERTFIRPKIDLTRKNQ